MNNELTITISNHNAMLIHFALVEYAKHICKDDCCKDEYELREIDKKLGYSGNFEE